MIRFWQFLYKAFFVSVCVLFLVVFAKGWQLITEGFRLDKIQQELTLKSEDQVISQDILSILDQKFHYLSKGCQVYVLESEDKQYVIKLLRYHKYHLPFWMRHIRGFNKGDAFYQHRFNHRKKMYDLTMQSYHIANTHLKEETGTIFVHLDKTTNFHKPLKIVDRLGRKNKIDLNNKGFIIQRKVKDLESTILQLKDQNEQEKVKETIQSFLSMVQSVYKKGFVIRDYNCIKNAGILDDRIIEMDIGSLHPQKDIDDPQVFAAELKNFVKHFRKWSVKKYAEILPYFDQQVDEIIKENEKSL